VLGRSHHEPVADPGGVSGDVDDGKASQWTEGAETLEVEVEEDAAVVVQDEVPQGVGALDWMNVGEPVSEEPI